MLSDSDILGALNNGEISVEPNPWYEENQASVQPASLDVRLDSRFRIFENHRYDYIDPSQYQPKLTKPVRVVQGQPFVLHPGELVLGSTYEKVTLSPKIAAQLNGKSSLGRLGLIVHSTAGFIDPGFSGTITLELANVANIPIRLWPGMKIGQLLFFRLESKVWSPYGTKSLKSRYQDQEGPQPSKAYANFDLVNVYGGK